MVVLDDLFKKVVVRDAEVVFDFAVSNPPYQATTFSSNKGAAVTIYHHFMKTAQEVSRFVSMIYPARWMTGTNGYKVEEFKTNELRSKKYQKMFIVSGEKSVFDNVTIKGGINYFLWDAEHDSKTEYVFDGEVELRDTLINGFDVMIRDPRHSKIVETVGTVNTLASLVMSRNHYGTVIESDHRIESFPIVENGMNVLYSGKGGGVKSRCVSPDVINKPIGDWKVFVSKTADPDVNTTMRRSGRVILAAPNVVCSNSFLKVGSFSTQLEAENLVRYLKTDLVTFLFGVITVTQNSTRRNYALVPDVDFSTGVILDKPDFSLDFSRHEELDEQLFDAFNIEVEDRVFISSIVRPWKGKFDIDADGLF